MNEKNVKPEQNNGVQKKIEKTRQEWGHEWALEKQTEGLDKEQAKDACCGEEEN